MSHAHTDLVDSYLALNKLLCSFQALGMVRLLVCQMIPVAGFSKNSRIPLAVKLNVINLCI